MVLYSDSIIFADNINLLPSEVKVTPLLPRSKIRNWSSSSNSVTILLNEGCEINRFRDALLIDPNFTISLMYSLFVSHLALFILLF